MNEDIVQGKWKQLRGQVRQWWGELTDDDVDEIQGQQERLIGKLQERYGYSKEEAMREVEQRLGKF